MLDSGQDNVVKSAAQSGKCADVTALSTYVRDDDLQTATETLRTLMN